MSKVATRSSKQPTVSERGRLLASRSQFGTELRERIERGSELRDQAIASVADLKQARDNYYTWNEYNTQLLKRRFSTDELTDEYSDSNGFVSFADRSFTERIEDHRQDVRRRLRKLESISARLELYDEPAQPEIARAPVGASIVAKSPAIGGDVFIVHGRAEAPKQEVARFLEAVTGMPPVILHEQVSSGMTVIEKLEHHADRIGFAVVVLTGDDEGRLRGTDDELLPRGRENVVLELGFFIGRLNRSRVVLLHESDVSLPSDVLGVVYVRLDAAGGWKLALARELKAAGYELDATRLI